MNLKCILPSENSQTPNADYIFVTFCKRRNLGQKHTSDCWGEWMATRDVRESSGTAVQLDCGGGYVTVCQTHRTVDPKGETELYVTYT